MTATKQPAMSCSAVAGCRKRHVALILAVLVAGCKTPCYEVDYMDGKPIRYRVNPDSQFVLYSVGEDEQDDFGSTVVRAGKSSQRNLWDRKDLVWPAPATRGGSGGI